VIASILIVAILILGLCLLIYRKAVKIMSGVNDINAVLDDLDKATNDVAARIDALVNAVKPGMTDAEVAAVKQRLSGETDRLRGLAADPNNPVPLPVPAPTPAP